MQFNNRMFDYVTFDMIYSLNLKYSLLVYTQKYGLHCLMRLWTEHFFISQVKINLQY